MVLLHKQALCVPGKFLSAGHWATAVPLRPLISPAKLRSKVKQTVHRQHTQCTHIYTRMVHVEYPVSIHLQSLTLYLLISLCHTSYHLIPFGRQTPFPVSLWWIAHHQAASSFSAGLITISTMTTHSDNIGAGQLAVWPRNLSVRLKAACRCWEPGSHKTVALDPLQTRHTHSHIHTHTLTHSLIYWISLSEVLRRCLVAGLPLGSVLAADASRVSPDSGLCVVIFIINYSLRA